MGLAQPVSKISVADYLAGELVSDSKHEYIDGEVYALAGTCRRHNQIAGNLYSRLNEHLRGGPCTAFAATSQPHRRSETASKRESLLGGVG